MNKNELIEIIESGESSKVEFKTEDVHPVALAEEIVAFANFEGGKILIGVSDNGVIKGCVREDLETFIVNICRNNVKPSIIPEIEHKVINNKKIFVVTIVKGDTPYSTGKGLYYIRVGSTKQIPTQQEVLRLFQKRNLIQFDETPVLRADLKSINLEKVNEYLVKLGQSALDIENETLLANDLLNLSILIEMDNGLFPTLGGLLAFGKHPQKHFPSYNIICGAYEGSDFLSDVIREKNLTGPFDEIIEDAISFTKLVMTQDRRLVGKVRRKDEYQYPVEALREAIVNAICHRDYTITGAAVRIFFFNDRIEIRSPGGLPNTLTVSSMVYRQFTRNQAIASFLAGHGFMEKRGKGILKIMKLCKDKGIQYDFRLMPDENEFVVTLKIH